MKNSFGFNTFVISLFVYSMSGLVKFMKDALWGDCTAWETYDYEKRMREIQVKVNEEEARRLAGESARAKEWMVSTCNDAMKHLEHGHKKYSARARFDVPCEQLHEIIDQIHQVNPSTRKILKKPRLDEDDDYTPSYYHYDSCHDIDVEYRIYNP